VNGRGCVGVSIDEEYVADVEIMGDTVRNLNRSMNVPVREKRRWCATGIIVDGAANTGFRDIGKVKVRLAVLNTREMTGGLSCSGRMI
jgi:hypothetical protein